MTRKRVLGYVILHRHGHRAPEKNIFHSNSEIELWKSFLPAENYLNQLLERFPIHIHENNQKPPFDVKTRPFGCLTVKGVNHLQSVGKNLGSVFPKLKGVKNARVYATNYQRTQVILEFYVISSSLGECSMSSGRIGGYRGNIYFCSG